MKEKASDSKEIQLLDSDDKYSKLRETLDKQNNLIDWKIDLVDLTFYNYRNLVISFGYVSLFAIVFPLTPFIYWIVTVADLYTSKSLLMNLAKRPNPVGAQDIGQWHACLRFIAISSIFCNSAIFCYTANDLFVLGTFLRIVVFFCSSFLLLFLFLLVDFSLSEDQGSLKVDELINRQTFLVQKMQKYILHRDEELNDFEKIVDHLRFKKSIKIKI